MTNEQNNRQLDDMLRQTEAYVTFRFCISTTTIIITNQTTNRRANQPHVLHFLTFPFSFTTQFAYSLTFAADGQLGRDGRGWASFAANVFCDAFYGLPSSDHKKE